MIDSETLEKLRGLSIEERISVIESILQTVKHDMQKDASSQAESTAYLPRPAFGFMKDTGNILGDVIAPILPETAWEVLQ